MLAGDLRYKQDQQNSFAAQLVKALRLDTTLLILLSLLSVLGLFILYSASSENADVMLKQSVRICLAFIVMFFLAQIPIQNLRVWTPWLYVFAVIALVLVFMIGVKGKGAQRWLDLGLLRFQPSELMKLIVPMTIAWYLSSKEIPPRLKHVIVAGVIIGLPMLLIVKQPDLGTALLVGFAGFAALFLAGLRWGLLFAGGVSVCALTPFVWQGLHDYQRQRILTFLNPENDPLGSGYHIIQSKIAIGSGGVYGKGWLSGTQAHLDFLPERSTDFIFSVFGEEFGLFGALLLLILYLLIMFRGIGIAVKARDSYSRILAGSISYTFIVYLVVNVGMVTGLLPVVGIPLPLVSYGGTSMVTLMAGFGILMSIRSDKRLISE